MRSSLDGYYSEFRTAIDDLLSRGGAMEEADQVLAFIEGLADPAMKAKVLSSNPATIDAAMLQARTFDVTASLKRTVIGAKGATPRYAGATYNHGDTARRPTVTCSYCGYTGHAQEDCRRRQRDRQQQQQQPQRPQQPPRPPQYRDQCGHGPSAPSRTHGVAAITGALAQSVSSPQSLAIVVQAHIAGHQVDALIDTGATISTVSPAFAKRIEEYVVNSRTALDVPTHTSPVIVEQKIKPSDLAIGRWSTRTPFIVVDSKYDAIVGLDVLTPAQAVVDLGRRLVTFPALAHDRRAVEIRATEQDEKAARAMLSMMAEYQVEDPTTIPVEEQLDNEVEQPDEPPGLRDSESDGDPAEDRHDFVVEQADFEDFVPTPQQEYIQSAPLLIQPLLRTFPECFAWTNSDLQVPANVEPAHLVRDPNAPPVYVAPYRLPFSERNFIQEETQALLSAGVIEPSTSAFNSPILVVPKPNGGGRRLVIDYRRLNSSNVHDNGPVPRVDDVLDAVGRRRYYSIIDLKSGFWQVPLDEESRPMTAFSTPDGHFQWRRVPMGIQAAPAIFNARMRTVLAGLRFVVFYFDDVIVATDTLEEHVEALRQLFERLREYGVKLNPAKCVWMREEIGCLGFRISAAGLAMDPAKVCAITDRSPPRNVKEVQVFLGICNYYRRFIDDYASVVAPIINLTKKGTLFLWSQPCQRAFDDLKTRLATAPVLRMPDLNLPFVLHTDASGTAIGAVLSQRFEDGEHPVQYASRVLAASERHYAITELECLAVVWSVHLFRPYLFGHPFEVVTDHQALKWLMSGKTHVGRLARWAIFLSGYSFTITYRRGVQHGNVDALSRPPTTEQINAVTRNVAAAHAPTGVDTAADVPDDLDELNDAPNPIAAADDRRNPDPAEDAALLHFVQYGRFRPGESKKTVNRITRIAPQYSWNEQQGVLMIDRKGVKLVIPPVQQRAAIIRQHHSLGHWQVEATQQRVAEGYYWPKMELSVARVVHACETCLRTRNVPQLVHPARARVPTSRVCHTIGMDLVFGLPETARGHIGLLVIEELTTKFPFVYPIRSKEAREIGRHLFNYIALCGPPAVILSDNGGEFCNNVIDAMCNLAGVERVVTSPYHPQANGSVERKNQTLITALRAHALQDPSDWDLWLDMVLLAYRGRRHTTTKFTPYQLLFGRDCPQFTTAAPEDTVVVPDPTLLAARVEEVKALIQTTRPAAATNVKQHQPAQQHQQDAQHSNNRVLQQPLTPGTRVWVRVGAIVIAKLAPRYTGPFQVIRQNQAGNYILRNADGRELKRAYPLDRLKVESVSTVTVPQPTAAAPADDIEGNQLYDVEDILDSRIRKGRVEYFVLWGGYPRSQATWEAETQFVDLAPIDRYWARRDAALPAHPALNGGEM